MRRLSILFFALAAAAQAQQPIANVNPQDATIAGDLQVSGGRAVLVGSSTVTAKDHTAELALSEAARCASAQPAACTSQQARAPPHPCR